MLATAQRPLILAGSDVDRGNANDALLKIAELEFLRHASNYGYKL